MPIRYVATLGAVVGIPELADVIEITFEKPAPIEITFQKPTPLEITFIATMTPYYGGD